MVAKRIFWFKHSSIFIFTLAKQKTLLFKVVAVFKCNFIEQILNVSAIRFCSFQHSIILTFNYVKNEYDWNFRLNCRAKLLSFEPIENHNLSFLVHSLNRIDLHICFCNSSFLKSYILVLCKKYHFQKGLFIFSQIYDSIF